MTRVSCSLASTRLFSSDEDSIYGNVHDSPLVELWVNSPNYKMGRLANNWCVAKKNGMPQRIQEKVMERLTQKYAKD
ncbi:MAG: hypothetical protein WC613_03880 [Candidatus Aenigmatarchaeota archaeon]